MTKFISIVNTVLVLVVLVLGYLLYTQNQRIKDLENKKYVTINNVLPDNVLADIEILKNTITEIQRVGPDSVYVIEQYVPHESEVHYVTELDSLAWNRLMLIQQQISSMEMSGDTTGLNELREDLEALKYQLFITRVDFDEYGLCLEPCAGLSANEHGQGEVVVGARLGYWNRYGIGIHGVATNFNPTHIENTEYGIGGFIDARIPHFENVSGFVGGGYNFTDEDWNARIGLQGYLN